MRKQIAISTLFTLVLLLLMTVPAFAAETAENTGLTQLAMPTELSWGRDYDWDSETYNEVPGFISWKRETPTQNQYQIIVYSRDTDEKVSNVIHHYPADFTSPYFSSSQFVEGYWYDEYQATADHNFDSGTYYFTVQALGDGVKYSDSEIATSPVWTYTKPTAILATPTNLHWKGRESHWDLPGDTSDAAGYAGGYVVEYYWYDVESQKYISVDGTSCPGLYSVSESLQDYLEDYGIEKYGIGQYYFRVRTLSSDITKVRNSLWSGLSPVYNLREISSDIDGTLNSILGNYATSDELADSEKTALKEELWAQTDTDSLDASMAADQTNSGTVSKIEELEYLVGGPANVNVSEDAPEGLDFGSISIIGANLNTEGAATATLNVSAPSLDAGLIPEQYGNTVQFSMKLDGVAETEQKQQLKVPVKITMPVPYGINPDFLVLLHFHSDGTYEEIQFPYVFEKNGQTFVSFVVTSFSDFAFAQRKFGISAMDVKKGTVTAAVATGTPATLVAAVYENGCMTGADTKTLTADDKADGQTWTFTLSLPTLTQGAQVKLFLFDSTGTPLYEAVSNPIG